MTDVPTAQVTLVAQERGLADAWGRSCGDLPGVTVHHGSILDVGCDAMVSPANSFGLMRGGIDAVYMTRFGEGLERRLQDQIRVRHHGELLVGMAEIVATKDPSVPWLIAAPTMRLPTCLGETVNPYLAARAVLLLVTRGRMPFGDHAGEPVCGHVRHLALPGLGTGVGGVSPEACARQVRAAFDHVYGGGPEVPGDHLTAAQEQRKLLEG